MQKESKPEDTADSSTTYQGWENYATWCVDLWLRNDSGSYHYWRDRTRSTVRGAWSMDNVINGLWTESEAARISLAEQLKEATHDESPLQEASVYTDLLGSALDDVNWSEIAASFIENFCD